MKRKINEKVLMKRKIKLTRFAKHFEWVLHWSQCLQNHAPNFSSENHSKIFKNKSNGKAT